ncbi:MAG: sigma-70 family RNA polymerase sigma factor [Solirubrobacterales bacterium]|nr:sigma-70 family RNA polymerase sigma factor [Solirubrobacterales bacterium]
MEASALQHSGSLGLRGPTPLLRLQSDERLVALARRGNQAAFEALVGRYQARLLSFCRHMLSSREDAEDVLQEVFAASFNAMLADDRPINVRPWLYRIARNRSLNHLRRHQAIGQDSMDVHLADHGTTTADRVQGREDFRQLVADVQELAETQRTALLLREIDALSYEQIAEAMETTVPSVKSLLVRARVSLAEASEARKLTCEEVRDELGEVSEGLRRVTPPVRRHARQCERCATFRKQLRCTNRQLAVLVPVAPLLFFKKFFLAHLGTTASAGGATAAGGVVASTAAAGGAGSLSAGIGAIASKTVAALAAAAIVTTGAVEVKQVRSERDGGAQAATEPRAPSPPPGPAAAPPPAAAPIAVVDETEKRERPRGTTPAAPDLRPARREEPRGEPDRARNEVEEPATADVETSGPAPAPTSEPTKPLLPTKPADGDSATGGQSSTKPVEGISSPESSSGSEPAQQQAAGGPVRGSGSSNDAKDGSAEERDHSAPIARTARTVISP